MFQWSNIVWQQKLGAIQQQEDEMGRRFFLDMGPSGRNEPQLPDQHWAYWANDAEIPTLHGGLMWYCLPQIATTQGQEKYFPMNLPSFYLWIYIYIYIFMEYFLMNILKWTSLILSVLVRDVFLHVRLGTPDPHGSALNPGKLVVKG